jgi:hypothetical protein
MSATPRTDEMELKGQPAIGGKAFIHSDFARTLERENQALREALDDCSRFLSSMNGAVGRHGLTVQRKQNIESRIARAEAALNKNSPVATAVGS